MTEPSPTFDVHISIGNSDNKLPQAVWAMYIASVERECGFWGKIHGAWFSKPDAEWQNASFAVELRERYKNEFRHALRLVAVQYEQESIAWLEGKTEFLTP